MTRIAIHPEQLGGASEGLHGIAVAERRLAGQLEAETLAPMPPSLMPGYIARLQAIATGLRRLASDLDELGATLRRRGELARRADMAIRLNSVGLMSPTGIASTGLVAMDPSSAS